ncbi:signal recognition particle-docking protein FtsY [candidate division KSB1 bacterium]|nr:signal recognition particle-docking protein FtsY [candidate division KSB1 bacterium]
MLKIASKLKKGLSKTKANLVENINHVMSMARKIDEGVLEELEEQLILSDMGVDTSETIIEQLREKIRQNKIKDQNDVLYVLKNELVALFNNQSIKPKNINEFKPFVISIVGVNGTGKTTTIGKLAYLFANEGYKVMLAAADTFRAAAIEQLNEWAKRSGVDVVIPQSGADPASVAFDAYKAALARNSDILIVDTAGRLHTKVNLMAELDKIHRVLNRQSPEAPHEVFLVMDATTGQNGLTQAKKFAESVNVSGLILTKLDGTAKGGIVFSIVKELNIPVRYIGLGEQLDDIEDFDPEMFVEALFQ